MSDNLTVPELKMLVEIEKKMEAGDQPYIINNGQKWAFPVDLLRAVGLNSGEQVSNSVRYQLQLLFLEYLKEQISIQENKDQYLS